MKSLKAKFRKSDTNEWSKNDERLLQAVEHGETEKVATLLGKKGVAASKLDSEGKTAFHVAATKGNAECLRVILAHGVDNISVQDTAGHTALHVAVKNNHLECVKKLLQAKCPVESTDISGKISLHYAAINGFLPAVQMLCEQKSPINIKDSDGNTPLLLSVLHGHTEVCKYLVDHKADINVKDNNGRTAIMLACETGNYNIVDTLVRRGADLKLMDALGHDAIHYSKLSRNSQILNLLLSKASQEPGPKTPTQPAQLSDLSSPVSSTSTPLSAKSQVFFPEHTSKDENTYQREYKDRLSDSTGTDSLLDVSLEAEHQDTVSLLQAKLAALTLQNKELQEKLKEKTSNEAVMDISCDSYHSTNTDLNVSAAKPQDEISPTGASDNSDLSFESQPEIASSEFKVMQLEKTIEDLQIKLDLSEAERKKLDAQIQPVSTSLCQSLSEEVVDEPSDLAQSVQEPVKENKDTLQNFQQMSEVCQANNDNTEASQENVITEELKLLKIEYGVVLEANERKEKEIKDLQHQIDVMKQNVVNLVSMEKLKEMEKSYHTMIETINEEKTKYKEELEEIRSQKELESRKERHVSDDDVKVNEAMAKTIEQLNKQVSELTLLYNEAQTEISKTQQASQDITSNFIHKDEHNQIVQEIMECKDKVEMDFTDLKEKYAVTLQEVHNLEEQLDDEKLASDSMQIVATLKSTINDLEAERNNLREHLSIQESKVKSLQEDLIEEKSIIQETMVTKKSFEELQTSLEKEISMLSTELEDLMTEKEKLSMDNAHVKQELLQLKGESDAVQSQFKAKEQEVNEYRLKYDKALEALNEMKKSSENTLRLDEDKDKKINELSKEVSKLKEALNSLSQLSFSSNTSKRQSQQLEAVQQQVKQLQNQLVETKKQHQEIVSVYRMHLLYAVQGQMDEDVQKVLKQILTMCKSQSQKI
ncbi:ankycorbin isoform X2 [Bombina bombina]|uniref:ankycorbin isoform X2 n=1 Tax=Bombina bombina TaxID=8345 RepID=UPI00235ADE79|nr:ankycorbin isoform X2 [Bombina bombina]